MHKRSHFEMEYHPPGDGSPPPFSPYGTFPSPAASIYPTPTSSFPGGDFYQPLDPVFDSIMQFNHVDITPYPVSPSTLGDPLWPVATTTTGVRDSCADVLLASPPFGRKNMNEAQERENEDEALSLSPLVRAGSHFGLALDLKQLARVFADNVWVWTPLNPSMLNDDRLLQLVQPASMQRKHTTLVLHACLALSWDEFFAMAREHAGMLFDRGTYANAEALYCMAYLAFCRGDLHKMGYYTTLAKDMCRQLGIVNSDVFTKCILISHIDPSVRFSELQAMYKEYDESCMERPQAEDMTRRSLIADQGNFWTAGMASGTVNAEKVGFGMGKIKDMGFCIAYANLYLKLIRRQAEKQGTDGSSSPPSSSGVPDVGSTWQAVGTAEWGAEPQEQVNEKRKLMFQLRGILQYWWRSLMEMVSLVKWYIVSGQVEHLSGNSEKAFQHMCNFLEEVQKFSPFLAFFWHTSCTYMHALVIEVLTTSARPDLVEMLLQLQSTASRRGINTRGS
ncbi:uncharacterized protein ACA1_253700 [Acanthamoeba castellanii str. Neff]|uniref:Uncharacterized protein n=1 Tax=Acanthamoeba castellanii (strain ATCC 30010 / Neff) TaxID=1257118 RepID=L8HC91_ACACF|nr:uncharacterized protein ACA1_253700 [Acanthamoeba castellanii str. Neff]ELR22373.1 hypothetical protein ACA1_253700 [Acanthamoeba castellanii str. Neff]